MIRRALPFVLLVGSVFAICYGGAAWWTSQYESLPAWDFAFEHSLPFVPSLSLIYLTIGPVLLLAPFLLRSRERIALFAAALCMETVIATVLFLLFPQSTAFVRPQVTGWARIPFTIADTLNLSYNEFPSLHVAFAVSAAIAYRHFAWILWAGAVAVSTLLIREHHLADILGGIVLAVAVMRVVARERTWVELCCIDQCLRFSRRHVRYFVIFLAIYIPSLLRWRRYRAVRTGFAAAQWIDDLLDGDRPSDREPLDVVDELLEEMERKRFSPRPLSRLVRAFFSEVNEGARARFIDLVRCMRRDRVRVLERQVWCECALEAHHRTTFTLSVDLLLATTGCTARAENVPALVDALAWCSVFRDLDDDLRKGLCNIPRGANVDAWTRASHARALVTLEQSAREIAMLEDRRARRILGVFQRSIEKFARRPVRPMANISGELVTPA